MKKIYCLLLFIVLLSSRITFSAINQGYVKLDELFGFSSSCRQSECSSNDVFCDKDCWKNAFHIVDTYHIDPNTYFFKTEQRERLLEYAVMQGNISIIKILLNKYAMRIVDKTFITAIDNNQRDALQVLLDNGAMPTNEVIDYAYRSNAQWAINLFIDYGFIQ